VELIIQKMIHAILGKSKLTFLDFLIIGLGIALLFYQILKRLSTFSTRRFLKKARENHHLIVRTEVSLNYLSTLIEVLPMLGLLGTVWGLRNALVVIAEYPNPTIGQIAVELAPALSTTYFGLLFAVSNLILYNYLDAFYSELCNTFRMELEAQSSVAPADEMYVEKNSMQQYMFFQQSIDASQYSVRKINMDSTFSISDNSLHTEGKEE